MIYQYLNDIDIRIKFEYLILFFIGTFIFQRILNVRTVISILIITFFLYLYHEHISKDQEKFLQDCQYILELPEFKQYKFLYLNSELLLFLHKIYRFKRYSPEIYQGLIASINHFLQLSAQIEQGFPNISNLYQILDDMKFKIINQYMSLIHKLPMTDLILNQYHYEKDELEKLLNQVLDASYVLMVYKLGKTEIDNSYKFIYKNQPKSYDRIFNPNYEIYN